MRAALRLWWTFFTAVPLQTVLVVVGCALFGLLVVVALLMSEPIWLAFGYLAFVILAASPALFTSPALFRSLSAPRTYQLLPHFRLRVLIAVSLLLCTLLVFSAGLVIGPTLLAERAFPFFELGVAAAFIVAMFLLLFLAFGDWRWAVLVPLSLVAVVNLRRWSPATADFLAALPAWVLPAAALGAWVTFAVWYLRVRQVRPVMLMPQQRAASVDAARPVPRTVAIRTLLVANARVPSLRGMSFRTTPLRFFALVLTLAGLTLGLRFFSLTSTFWPLAFMLFFGERSAAIVRQSRLLWLNIPGSRDAVRSEIEKVLWRNLGFGAALLVVVAAIAASPLVGAGAARALLGLAVTAGAALYGTYVAMAAVPSVVATYLCGFAPVVLLQVVLLARAEPSLTAVAVVTGVELAGAVLVRALAIRRWRTLDWLRMRPLPTLVGVPRSL
jgi:hypothetical protein